MRQVYELSQFGFLRVSGRDAVKFLQGYTTCDLEKLDEASVQMGAICNIQGRMLSSFLVIKDGQDLLLRLSASLIPATIDFLSKYIVFSKAQLSNMSDSLACYGLLDEPASDISVQRHSDGLTLQLGERTECWFTKPAMPEGNVTDDTAAWRQAEISAGIVWVDEHSTEAFLPQMFSYHTLDAIDFTKGCYLGQEIVARMQYRGELKRQLHRLPVVISREGGEDIDVVAIGSQSTLAVLKNASGEPVTIEINGQQLTATPVSVVASEEAP